MPPPEAILRRLPCVLPPLTNETLPSFLARLAAKNHLPAHALTTLVGNAEDGATAVAKLTDRPRRSIVSALPQTRTADDLTRWPYLLGKPSASAKTTDACQLCAAARGDPGARIHVHTTHDQVICLVHYRWTGGPLLATTGSSQFSIAACPAIVDAHLAHRVLIAQWGRHRVQFWFEEAIIALQNWRRLGATRTDPAVATRTAQLHAIDPRPGSPHDCAAHYPTTVQLTAMLLQLRHDLDHHGEPTPKILARGRTQIAGIISGLRPTGAWDPYVRALDATYMQPPDEVETPP